jgi:hypothetical protein
MNNHYTFEAIDRRVQEFDILESSSRTAVQTPEALMERLVTVYATVKPILLALTDSRFIPKSWRRVLTIFTVAMDEVTATLDAVSESFKAGKDQLTDEGGDQVEMEPKLPVG